MAIRLSHPLRHHLLNPNHHTSKPLRIRKLSIKNEKSEPVEPHKKEDQIGNEKLCVFLIEKALSRLPDGKEEILGIFDFRGFGTENSDFEFLRFLFDVFYYYYPKRLGQVLFVDTPFLFFPLWQLIKPLLRSYASLVRFCSTDTVRKEYFTETTVPTNFRD